MKRILFTLMAMLALVLMANTTFAQLNETSVYPGGTYNYSLSGVAVTTANATGADISFTGFNNDPTVTNFDPSVGTTAADLTFTLEYDNPETADANNVIRVTITEGSGGCSNYIELTITVLAPPTWTLSIVSDQTSDDYGCQQPLASPSDDGTADAYTGGDNTIVFTTSTGAAPAGSPTLAYTIAVTGASCSSCGVGETAVGDYNATFTSTEGAGFNVVGTLSAATFTMDANNGGGTYDMDLTGSGSPKTVTVSALPTIGSF